MCQEHEKGFGFMPFRRFRHTFMGCSPMEVSKETKIKSLEATKAHIEDYLKHIDEKIKELQKEKA